MPAKLVKQATLATLSRKPRNLETMEARYLRDTCLISLSLSLSPFAFPCQKGMGWASFTNGVTKRMKADRVCARARVCRRDAISCSIVTSLPEGEGEEGNKRGF